MKLFITNKSEFDAHFKSLDDRYYSSRRIHQKAFNQLQQNISEGSIPLTILQNYSDCYEGVCIFDFKSKKGDVFFYEFACTAS